MTATAGPEAQVRTGLLIGGQTVETPESTPVHDPAAPDRVVGYAAAATPEHTRRAVDAAQGAWQDWSRRDPQDRAGILTESLGALDADHDERTDLLVLENGKVRAEAAVEMGVFAQRCRLAAGLADELRRVRRHSWAGHADMVSTTGAEGGGGDESVARFSSEVSLMPLGVVTIIIPFNWPLAILAASLPYALVAGNTVIVKAPPTTPLSVVRTLERLAERLPAGVLNVVTGGNEGVAPALEDPRVRRIVFTGSTNAGRKIMAAAAGNITRVTLELGGNDPAVLLDDVDLNDVTITRLVEGGFMTTGQVCMGIKRVYAPRSRFDELVARMSESLDRYRIGHGLAPESTMGPLNSGKQRDYVRELLDDARANGREVREFGTVGDEVNEAGGHFLRPALVLDPAPDERIVNEEQFGPVLPIIAYDDLDEVVETINNDWSGLCSSVWTADDARAADLAGRLRTGTTWVNDANAVAQDDRAPFGGFRQSGMGRELGVDGLIEMTEAHTVTYTRRP
ncbi:aldehyde dehydrogenase family protein [Streptomonospora sp. PA3]|uniref:aldehyde dehydrogenase family protein n=1 Tax=Streptomonospora sp. PA3 TaxID=2607326 RepID=UPI0012DF1649|nr:aldehyde dehydrogenase family protein [Streptomonospora sp. PA3]MUL41773.1 aldehyde dehydrogenase family protein [Streptomonospora sp. PA3]